MTIPYDYDPFGVGYGGRSTAMYYDGTALKGLLFNPCLATSVGEGADGSALVDGSRMFLNCTTLTSWTTDLPNLTTGTNMFNGCSTLTSWTADLPKLTNGV